MYYLKAIPWQVPGFTVDKYFENLMEMDNIIRKEGNIDFTCNMFFIEAYKNWPEKIPRFEPGCFLREYLCVYPVNPGK